MELIEAGLKCVQGKRWSNSIAGKRAKPSSSARPAAAPLRGGGHRHGVDEQGQADTLARRSRSAPVPSSAAERSGFRPRTSSSIPTSRIATGLEEHNNYAIDFIEATRVIKQALPHAKVSGGVSNISFSFRGNDSVREAIHTAFLYHAINAGMTMGIANAGQLGAYEEIPKELLELVEDVLFNRRPDATERLVQFARVTRGRAASGDGPAWRNGSVQERLAHALVRASTPGSSRIPKRHPSVRAPDPGDRGAVDGRHEHRGRSVWRRQMFLPQVVNRRAS